MVDPDNLLANTDLRKLPDFSSETRLRLNFASTYPCQFCGFRTLLAADGGIPEKSPWKILKDFGTQSLTFLVGCSQVLNV
jgi:hypothetical protein